MRAIVAVEHAMVIAAWNLLTKDDFYRDPTPAPTTTPRTDPTSPKHAPSTNFTPWATASPRTTR
jgi:hypothetical protein